VPRPRIIRRETFHRLVFGDEHQIHALQTELRSGSGEREGGKRLQDVLPSLKCAYGPFGLPERIRRPRHRPP
jgi:hypothetical protein